MQKYEPRDISPVEAVQWNGTRKQAQEIISWIDKSGYRATYVDYGPGWPDRIQFTDGDILESIEPQEWIVRKSIWPEVNKTVHDFFMFDILSEFDFEQRYKESDA